MKQTQTKQAGAGLILTLITLSAIGAVAIFIVRLVPVYSEYWTIRSVVTSLNGEAGIEKQSDYEIQKRLQKRFLVEGIKPKDVSSLELNRTAEKLLISLDYERRRPLFGNMDIVVKFNETFEVKGH